MHTLLGRDGPYLLGNTVEWKLSYEGGDALRISSGPYLLGNTVEWKRSHCHYNDETELVRVPTCWGTQLNGNTTTFTLAGARLKKVPTCWGTQLNGNFLDFANLFLNFALVPTCWGTQLNGNRGGM